MRSTETAGVNRTATFTILQCHFVVLLFFTSSSMIPPAMAQSKLERFVRAAIERTEHDVIYDGSYLAIAYPDGDVPGRIGVCTDVVIRTYRQIDVDLQQLVHEDMIQNFAKYPSQRLWGLRQPDSNIDHRRVPNLQTFFNRHGQVLSITDQPQDYHPGDLVTWMLPNGRPHIGIVTDRREAVSGHPMIVHNIGAGPQLDHMLFDYEITGHYRFMP